jgi:hypothetical protein
MRSRTVNVLAHGLPALQSRSSMLDAGGRASPSDGLGRRRNCPLRHHARNCHHRILIRGNPLPDRRTVHRHEVLQTGTCRTSADIVWSRARHHIVGQVILHLLPSSCSRTRFGGGSAWRSTRRTKRWPRGSRAHCALAGTVEVDRLSAVRWRPKTRTARRAQSSATMPQSRSKPNSGRSGQARRTLRLRAGCRRLRSTLGDCVHLARGGPLIDGWGRQGLVRSCGSSEGRANGTCCVPGVRREVSSGGSRRDRPRSVPCPLSTRPRPYSATSSRRS